MTHEHRKDSIMNDSHDCVKRVNEQLADHNTRLSWAIGVIGSEGELIQLATCKADEKKRGRPALMFASHCPFCGVKLAREGAPA